MSFKLSLNAGHGLNTAGKRCMKSIDPKETREWTLNSRICNYIEQKLKKYDGYELIRLDDTTGATDVALTKRTDKANAFGADFYLSIHHNAGVKGGSGGGVVAYTFTAVDSVTKEWQKELYDAIIKHTGLKGNRSRPLSTSNLHECRESKMPSVLLECGFMDSTTDTPIILTDDYANKVATACVEVIVARAGLVKKNVTAEVVYVVKKGDTLASIARRYGTTYEVLAEYNNIANPNKISVGQGIAIPSNVKKEEPKVTYFPKYTGTSNSITTGLKAVGAKTSFAYRATIAKANNVKLYVGTAKQNTTMLNLLKQGKLIKP